MQKALWRNTVKIRRRFLQMKKQELLDLGIDEETVKAVIAIHAKDIQEANAKTAAAEQARDDLQVRVDGYDDQLAEIKKSAGDNEELKNQIKDLQDANKKTAKDYQNKLAEQQKEFRIESALRDANAKNPKAVKALLDLEKVSVDGDNVIGLDDQLKNLQESEGYLFGDKQPNGAKKVFTQGNPAGGNPDKGIGDAISDKNSNLTEMLAENANKGE